VPSFEQTPWLGKNLPSTFLIILPEEEQGRGAERNKTLEGGGKKEKPSGKEKGDIP